MLPTPRSSMRPSNLAMIPNTATSPTIPEESHTIIPNTNNFPTNIIMGLAQPSPPPSPPNTLRPMIGPGTTGAKRPTAPKRSPAPVQARQLLQDSPWGLLRDNIQRETQSQTQTQNQKKILKNNDTIKSSKSKKLNKDSSTTTLEQQRESVRRLSQNSPNLSGRMSRQQSPSSTSHSGTNSCRQTPIKIRNQSPVPVAKPVTQTNTISVKLAGTVPGPGSSLSSSTVDSESTIAKDVQNLGTKNHVTGTKNDQKTNDKFVSVTTNEPKAETKKVDQEQIYIDNVNISDRSSSNLVSSENCTDNITELNSNTNSKQLQVSDSECNLQFTSNPQVMPSPAVSCKIIDQQQTLEQTLFNQAQSPQPQALDTKSKSLILTGNDSETQSQTTDVAVQPIINNDNDTVIKTSQAQVSPMISMRPRPGPSAEPIIASDTVTNNKLGQESESEVSDNKISECTLVTVPPPPPPPPPPPQLNLNNLNLIPDAGSSTGLYSDSSPTIAGIPKTPVSPCENPIHNSNSQSFHRTTKSTFTSKYSPRSNGNNIDVEIQNIEYVVSMNRQSLGPLGVKSNLQKNSTNNKGINLKSDGYNFNINNRDNKPGLKEIDHTKSSNYNDIIRVSNTSSGGGTGSNRSSLTLNQNNNLNQTGRTSAEYFHLSPQSVYTNNNNSNSSLHTGTGSGVTGTNLNSAILALNPPLINPAAVTAKEIIQTQTDNDNNQSEHSDDNEEDSDEKNNEAPIEIRQLSSKIRDNWLKKDEELEKCKERIRILEQKNEELSTTIENQKIINETRNNNIVDATTTPRYIQPTPRTVNAAQNLFAPPSVIPGKLSLDLLSASASSSASSSATLPPAESQDKSHKRRQPMENSYDKDNESESADDYDTVYIKPPVDRIPARDLNHNDSKKGLTVTASALTICPGYCIDIDSKHSSQNIRLQESQKVEHQSLSLSKPELLLYLAKRQYYYSKLSNDNRFVRLALRKGYDILLDEYENKVLDYRNGWLPSEEIMIIKQGQHSNSMVKVHESSESEYIRQLQFYIQKKLLSNIGMQILPSEEFRMNVNVDFKISIPLKSVRDSQTPVDSDTDADSDKVLLTLPTSSWEYRILDWVMGIETDIRLNEENYNKIFDSDSNFKIILPSLTKTDRRMDNYRRTVEVSLRTLVRVLQRAGKVTGQWKKPSSTTLDSQDLTVKSESQFNHLNQEKSIVTTLTSLSSSCPMNQNLAVINESVDSSETQSDHDQDAVVDSSDSNLDSSSKRINFTRPSKTMLLYNKVTDSVWFMYVTVPKFFIYDLPVKVTKKSINTTTSVVSIASSSVGSMMRM